MNSLVLKKVSGILFLVGAIFIMIGSVVALSEDETLINADIVVLNLLLCNSFDFCRNTRFLIEI